MSPVNSEVFRHFKESLSETAVLVTPESASYKESIKRWSIAAEKPAVGSSPSLLYMCSSFQTLI